MTKQREKEIKDSVSVLSKEVVNLHRKLFTHDEFDIYIFSNIEVAVEKIKRQLLTPTNNE